MKRGYHSSTSPAAVALAGDVLAVGEVVPARDKVTATAVLVQSGWLMLNYFTAARTETITTIGAATGSTAAAATPTLCRMGVYSVAANGDLTLVASTSNDTTLFGSTFNMHSRALSSSFSKVAGRRYAMGLLVVTAATMPNFHGIVLGATTVVSNLLRANPPLIGRVTGQTDLPASVPVGSILGYQHIPLMQLS